MGQEHSSDSYWSDSSSRLPSVSSSDASPCNRERISSTSSTSSSNGESTSSASSSTASSDWSVPVQEPAPPPLKKRRLTAADVKPINTKLFIDPIDLKLKQNLYAPGPYVRPAEQAKVNSFFVPEKPKPNFKQSDFMSLIGLEAVTGCVDEDGNVVQAPPVTILQPYTCLECSTDFTPVWKAEKSGVLCQLCARNVNKENKTINPVPPHKPVSSTNTNNGSVQPKLGDIFTVTVIQKSVTAPKFPVVVPQKMVAVPQKPMAAPNRPLAVPNRSLAVSHKPVPVPHKHVAALPKPVTVPQKPVPVPHKHVAAPPKHAADLHKHAADLRKRVPVPQKPLIVPNRPLAVPNRPVAVAQRHLAVPHKPVAAPPKPELIPHKHVAAPPKPVVVPQKPVAVPNNPVTAPKRPVAGPKRPVHTPNRCVAIPQTPLAVLQMPVSLNSVPGYYRLDASLLIRKLQQLQRG